MISKKNGNKKNGKKLATQQSVDQVIKSICDIMRRGNCAGALQYVPELTWILFLRILDEREQKEQEEYEAVGMSFTPSIEPPYRWQDWASPEGEKYKELKEGASGAFFNFVNGYADAKGNMSGLLPYLKNLRNLPNATPRQKVISEIMTSVERIRIDTERNFLDVADKVHEITADSVADTHVFTLSQVYEGLLLKMGEKGNDGGQFFTPREIIRVMVQVIAPNIDESVYDPGCGTGGFLAQTFEYIRNRLGENMTPGQIDTLKNQTFWGREKENLIYPIALANLILHGLDKPNLWHGNTLTGDETYGGLFEGSPHQFDVILTNPPFGGKEGKDAQTDFDYKTGSTQVLFLQHVLKSLKDGGRCGIVVDEGLLFRTNEDAFVKTKRKLLNECDVFCIVSLPGGVFTAAGAGVKTNLVFFKKGEQTKKIWYYDLSDIKVGKKTPLTLKHFEDFFALLPKRSDSDHSWTVNMKQRQRNALNESRPFKDKANHKQQEANQWKDRLGELKKIKPSDEEAIAEAETLFKELTKEAKELLNKAKEIEDAVYDLKAVNPNKKSVTDTRTPEQLLDLVHEKGRAISEALAMLRVG